MVGADRLIDGALPYGHVPDVGRRRPAAGYRSGGDPVGYVQRTTGRCESPVSNGDTYGPAVYVAYVPFVAILGWSGLWDDLPAAHVAASAFDIAAILGLFVAGWRLGSRRLGVLLAFGWAANPFTLYALNLNTNDALVGALLAWMMALLARPAAARRDAGAAALSKLSPLCLVPLMFSLRHRLATLAGFVVAGLLLCSIAVPPRRLAAHVLGRDAGLPARPRDAAVDLDAARVPPGLARHRLAAAGRPGGRRAGAACCSRCCRAGRKDAAAGRGAGRRRDAGDADGRPATGSTRTSAGGCRWCCSALLLPRESARPELTTPIRGA